MSKEIKSLLQEEGWKRIASVTPGGKAFFHYRRTERGREWIVWNRQSQQWQRGVAL